MSKHKNKIIIAVLSLVLLSGFIWFFVNRPRNIFEEIYRVEQSFYPNPNETLNKIKGLSTHSYKDSGEEFRYSASESYNEKYIPKGYDYIGFSFYFKNPGTFSLSFDKKLDSDITFSIYYMYYTKDKTLKQKIGFSKRGTSISDNAEIQRLLSHYNISSESLKTYRKEIFNDFFLRDWCKVYDSGFSSNDWGEVKVEENWSIAS